MFLDRIDVAHPIPHYPVSNKIWIKLHMAHSIGFIGLGVLGSAMATNLLRDGHQVMGFDVREDALEGLTEIGLTAASSPRDAADQTDVVVTCLPTIDALQAVFGGAEGLHQSAKNDQIIIEASTFPVAEKEKARDAVLGAGKRVLDCPVSGNRILAEQKKLTAFASGNEADYESVKSVISGSSSAELSILLPCLHGFTPLPSCRLQMLRRSLSLFQCMPQLVRSCSWGSRRIKYAGWPSF